MNKKQLLEQLTDLSDDAMIVIPTETGYNDVEDITKQELYHKPNDNWYEGDYQESADTNVKVECIIIE